MHDIHRFCMSQCHLVKIFEHVVFIGHQKCNAVLYCGTYKHVHPRSTYLARSSILTGVAGTCSGDLSTQDTCKEWFAAARVVKTSPIVAKAFLRACWVTMIFWLVSTVLFWFRPSWQAYFRPIFTAFIVPSFAAVLGNALFC